jgi:hypothetical protein
MPYGRARAGWRGEKFRKEFPNEPKYRHSLKEEAESFRQMIAVLKAEEDYQTKPKELDGPLRALVILQGVGLLEPILLLDRADAGIAQDYPAYRAAHRDKIGEYLSGFMVPKTPKVAAQ